MLDQVLGQHGIHDNDFDAIAEFLARTKSRLMAIELEDLLELRDQPNIPGTIDQHPNWRRRMPLCIDEIASTVDMAGLKDATRERRREKGLGARGR
jgi:4-alpha-glucanotransferase